MSFLFGLVEILVTYVFVGICMLAGIMVISIVLNPNLKEEWSEDKLIR